MIPAPKFVLSKSRLFEQYKILEDLGLGISYSVKTNPTVACVLEENRDCFFSVHTKQELDFIRDKTRIWFLAESWNKQEIQQLINKGIKNFIIYNVNDLNTLTDFLEKNPIKINLLLRVKLRENTIFTERYFVFGLDAKTLNIQIHKLRKNKNIEKLGLHFHRKTQNVSEWALKYELNNILEPRTMEETDIVNIGGGLPVRYRNTGDDALSHIFKKIKELKVWLEEHNIQMIIEPGRFLSGPSIKLEAYVTNVVGNTITVNCSVYNSSMDTLVVPIKLLVEGELPEKKGKKYTIKGCTPCSMDIFRYSVNLPEKKPGDKIVFLNAGAYNFHTDFCSLEKIETEIVD